MKEQLSNLRVLWDARLELLKVQDLALVVALQGKEKMNSPLTM
jgi:hypothetical protein